MFTVLCSAVKTKLTWVNGIAHTYEHMENGARPISKCFNKEVDFCYNPTSMTTESDYIGFLGDLRQASFQRFAGKITNEVNTLVEHLRSSIKEVGKNGKIIHIAHSQGAIITALAANNLTAAEMQQIEVLTFGGGTAITRNQYPSFSRVINYYAINDPLLFINPIAARALRTGFAFCSMTGEQEFVFLTPRMGDPTLDHGLLGDTYFEALTWEGRRYQLMYQNMIIRTMRPLYLAMLLCFSDASDLVTGCLSFILVKYIAPFYALIQAFFSWIWANVLIPWQVFNKRFVVPCLTILEALIDLMMTRWREFLGKEKFEPISDTS